MNYWHGILSCYLDKQQRVDLLEGIGVKVPYRIFLEQVFETKRPEIKMDCVWAYSTAA